jgi:hypothetical protein
LAGKLVVKQVDSNAGLRGWKKRMSCCNGVNTNSSNLTRKRAYVQLVFYCKRVCRINLMEKSKKMRDSKMINFCYEAITINPKIKEAVLK